jgi:hypothetical protein
MEHDYPDGIGNDQISSGSVKYSTGTEIANVYPGHGKDFLS